MGGTEIFHSNFLTLKRFFVNMGKEKKEKKALDESQTNGTNGDTTDEISYEDRLNFVSVIAKPMASKKLAKKLYKVIKKGMKHKTYVRNGLKDVQSRIRKGERGIVVFTPSRSLLGQAMGVKRGSLMVLIKKHDDYEELYNECKEEVEKLPTVTTTA